MFFMEFSNHHATPMLMVPASIVPMNYACVHTCVNKFSAQKLLNKCNSRWIVVCARYKNVPELRTLILEGFSCSAQVWNHWGKRQPGPCLCNQRFWSIHLQSVFPGKWDQRHTQWWYSILVSEQITKRAIVKTLNFVVPWTTNLV